MSTVTQVREMAAHSDANVFSRTRAGARFSYRACLIVLFLVSLPLVNPWIRGDGVGYYAFARAILIDHDLRFEPDWLSANPSFRQGRVDAEGRIRASQYTRTGYLNNHFTIGPAILWAPFLSLTHGAVLLASRMGAKVAANGFSRPYIVTIALATAAYGFTGLLLSFDLARDFTEERWSFLATAGILAASSLPVYLYFNPSWSHALSAFAVSLFLWYWHHTRGGRTLLQWCLLAAIAGLMMNIYYANVFFLCVPGIEAAADYVKAFQQEGKLRQRWGALIVRHALFLLLVAAMLTPTFVTRWIIYGSAFETGYPPMRTWAWSSPALLPVLFSADHGMLTWTPILALAIVGLILFYRRDRIFGAGLLLSLAPFYYFIACYADWDGLSSFGNRFFVSFTPVFIIGLAVAFDSFARAWKRPGNDFAAAATVVSLLALWNAGFLFQWGTQMIPARGKISWSQMVHNQFTEVPGRLTSGLENYLLRRNTMMQEIETRDLPLSRKGRR